MSLRSPGAWRVAGLVALAVLHYALARDVALGKSPTVDEIHHVPAGIATVERGTFAMDRHSPPLTRVVAGLAARGAGMAIDYEHAWTLGTAGIWNFGLECLLANEHQPARWLDAFGRARSVHALWSVAIIPLLFWWGRHRAGEGAGWLAAALWTLSPDAIAYAGLVTSDMPLACAQLVACLAYAAWLARPSWARAAGAGAGFGFAMLTKLTALWLVPTWLVWGVAHAASAKRGSVKWPILAALGHVLAMAGVALAVINAGYLFEGTGTPLGDFTFACDGLTRWREPADGVESSPIRTTQKILERRVNRFRGTLLARLPVPLPEHFVAGFDEIRLIADGGSVALDEPHALQMYLRGERRHRSWWYYFPYAMAVKFPVVLWVLLGVVCVVRGPVLRIAGPWLLIALVPIVAACVSLNVAVGVRYVLPSLPFLILAGATAVRVSAVRAAWRAAFALALVAWNAAAVVQVHPHELAYMNELVGGTSNGRFHLADSNVDWGQDLRALVRWVERHPEWADVRLAYMGHVPPELEGLARYELAPRDLRFVDPSRRLSYEREDDPWSFGPQPGRFAVSVNYERGLQYSSPCPRTLRDAHRARMSPPPLLFMPAGCYAYFQRFAPVFEPEVGYSILLYEVTPAQADAARVALGLAPLPPR